MNFIPWILCFAFALLLSPAARAGSCNDKGTTLDIVDCLGREAGDWERVVEESFANSIKDASPEQANAQRAAQEKWKSFRDANCRAIGMGEGSISAVEAAQCLVDMNQQRAYQLGADDEPAQPKD